MLATLALLLQVATGAQSAGSAQALTVRMGDRVRTVSTVRHPDGGIAVRADALAEALGGQVVTQRTSPARYRFEVGTTGVDIEAGSTLAVTAGDTLPLTARVYRLGTALYVPLTLAVDVLPRLGAGVMFDAEKGELRRFAAVVAGRGRTTDTPPARAAATRPPASSASPPPAAAPRVATQTPAGGARQHVVIVDAGHGGVDNGMSGPIGAPRKIYEKNITLAVSKQLAKALEQRNVKVVMTRTTDTLIALGDRGRIANQAKGDVFVSIHVNAANPRWKNPGGARGYETYFLAEAKTEDERRVAAMENESIRFETTVDATRDDPLGFIIRDMAQNEHLRESGRLAQLVQGGLKAVHPGVNRGVKQAGFVVLVTAFMPAVLVEIGFGSNPNDSAYMTNPEKQAEMAASLADAIVKYLAEYERKVSTP
ncbi:MAG TPA: N-acetylmuramoyl-L-alanine amidase [Gemmatimonas sp.]|uniref:N-acetylmuramoyl-L-alanine amidase family protein n=1 Tax=Gemmatimonas sp. TaxID=1962908 RepID=UPI002ED9574B